MTTDSDALGAFFKLVFGKEAGFVCFAKMDEKMENYEETFFEWPQDRGRMIRWIDTYQVGHNLYFCPQLLMTRKRTKDSVKVCTNIWADLDTCAPELLMLEPTIAVRSSPGRYQALWVLNAPMEPLAAQDIAMRIAYYHAPSGADRSGWDLTQLLRLPGSFNYKYGKFGFDAPQVELTSVKLTTYNKDQFEVYPEVRSKRELTLPMPQVLPTEDPVSILQRNRWRLNPTTFGLYSTEPEKSWSEPLWRLMLYCFEAGLTREEVFVVADAAACNKYKRENKSPEYLWRDVCRAYIRHQEAISSIVVAADLDDLLTDQEVRDVEADSTFVEEYIRWASGVGDAATQYHQAGAFVILSSILAGSVRIPTSFGNITPNLWFMILADTTLTRKTTAMDMAMELVLEIDEDVLLATDGSIEGMMQAMTMRPGRPTVFLRDEFSGLLAQISKKDYMAGTSELLTKLYDGKPQKRVLRKEVISVSKPILIIFAGGIKEKVQSLLTPEDISSGFMPRFLFITAESQVSRVRPLGPPSPRDMGQRDFLAGRVRNIYEHYNQQTKISVEGTDFVSTRQREWKAELTPDAWNRYGVLERAMTIAGTSSERADLMVPTYARMAISGLKAATLIAASRQRPEGDTVVVEERDIVHALYYVQNWREYGNDVINGVGKSAAERELNKIVNAIIKNPGISRSKLMQHYHLTARQASSIFATLEERGQITPIKVGQGWTYHPIKIGE